MEVLFKIAALCLLTAAVAALVRRSGGEMALLLSLGAAVCAAVLLSAVLAPLLELLKGLTELTGLAPDTFAPLWKVLAIALTVRAGGALCRDASQSALAAVLETAGAVCALLAAAPLLRAVVKLVEGWL